MQVFIPKHWFQHINITTCKNLFHVVLSAKQCFLYHNQWRVRSLNAKKPGQLRSLEGPVKHPVRQLLVIPPERVEAVDHARQVALAVKLLLQPGAGQPVGGEVVGELKKGFFHL